MTPLLLQEVAGAINPERLAAQLRSEPGLVLLRSGFFESLRARYSFLAARPFLTFRSFDARCEIRTRTATHVQYGNPWHLLNEWVARYELLDQVDLPFPLGGCFGYWGYDLKNFIEPKLTRRARNDLELPDCHLGFYASLLVIDHRLGKSWIVSTGLASDGSRTPAQARRDLDWWQARLGAPPPAAQSPTQRYRRLPICPPAPTCNLPPSTCNSFTPHSNLSRAAFLNLIRRAQAYIRAGHIYQVNLSQRLALPQPVSGWDLFQNLTAVSPAPFAAYLECGAFQIASSSPELFLRMSGAHIETRPIKGTRPRSPDPTRDAQLAYELQTSAKENSELVMITDLLRNDLGKVCEFGSIHTPELVRLEPYPQVQHLVSTVEGRLRPETSHLEAFASCFPGGSITGAPKFRAMQIIDELEPTARGPYTGALGYIGFNRETQLSIIIRAAICTASAVYFPAGAGIVADSDPDAEYQETLAKAQGFFEAIPSGAAQAA